MKSHGGVDKGELAVENVPALRAGLPNLLKHIENITKQYIDEHISRGRKNNAVCDLLVKLQFDLRKILQADDTTQANELIDMAKERGIIDRKEADILHKLRICRNRLQHPDKGEARFEQADIERWRDIVFSIGGNK